MFFASHAYSGSFSKQITVTSNDPQHRNDILRCQGQVKLPIDITPRDVDFGSIARHVATQYQTIALTRGEGGPINPKLVDEGGKPPQGLDAQICEVEPGEHYDLVLSLAPPFSEGRMNERLFVDPGIEGAPKQAIRVGADVLPRLSAKPGQFMFPANRPQDTQLEVRLTWDDNPGKIVGTECTLAEAKVEVEDSPSGATVRVTLPAGPERYPGANHVTITTDDKETPVLTVPITFKHDLPKESRFTRDRSTGRQAGGNAGSGSSQDKGVKPK